jgi:PadR family transcriptional regulator PadR
MSPDPSPTPLSEHAFYILLSLASGPRHGYAVLKDIELLSDGRISLSVSTLYTSLARLQEHGLIERMDNGDDEPGPGLPRKTYRLTSHGQAALDVEAWRLRSLLAAYHQRLEAQNP